MAVVSQNNSHEVSFISPDEDQFPQLMRLAVDFDFRVVTETRPHGAAGKDYFITYRHSRDRYATAITPRFNSLSALEAYTNDHVIDILHQTLFASTEED